VNETVAFQRFVAAKTQEAANADIIEREPDDFFFAERFSNLESQ
jgi:hypothetical protein